MNYKFFYVFLLVIISACAIRSQQSPSNSGFTGILIEGVAPMGSYDSTRDVYFIKEYIPTFTRIYYNGTQQLIQTSYLHDEYQSVNGEIVAEKHSTKFRTFIISDSASSGIYFDSLDYKKHMKFTRDSLLSSEWAFADNYGKVLDQWDEKLIGTVKNSDGDVVEKYFLVYPKDSATAMLELTWSDKKLKDIPYRMSPQFEEKKGRRLLQGILTLNPAIIPGMKSIQDTMRLSAKITRIENANQTELISLFKFAQTVKN